ncbi:MAG: sugar-binding transcriptional regulator, partial [Hyphomicrobiaceae bacterium]|nr:sugar-binding transcriptional regulator [Hyphomicrobiaceae bacterium]
MYFVEQMTQSEIAERLGIGRVTVVRMLADARARGEVKVVVEGTLTELVKLERRLEQAFGLSQAIVAPLSAPDADPIPAISASTGQLLSDTVRAGMSIGVGWGQTLYATLPFIAARPLDEVTVISLLGGVGTARRHNPAEFAWRFSQLFNGDAYLIPAPAVVDSRKTRDTLIECCGIGDALKRADSLDAVLVSVGDIASATTFTRGGYLTDDDRRRFEAKGAVGDLLFHFFREDGTLIDDPVNEQIMSVEIERLRKAPMRILASGGAQKVAAMRGVIALLRPTVIVTDEMTARGLLSR